MLNLIKAEFKKIFKKKSFLIVTIIFIFYAIFTNFIYKNLNALEETSTYNIAELKDENSKLDLNNPEDLNLFITNLTRIEIENLKKDFSNSSDQYLVERYLYNDLNKLIKARYESDSDDSIITEYNTLLEIIKKGDYEYFVQNNIARYQNELLEIKGSLVKERLNILIKLEEYRLNNKIDYAKDNYLNNALENIRINLVEYTNLKNKTTLNHSEQDRLEYLQEVMTKNKYILEHQMDTENSETLRAVLSSFPEEFGLFILIYVILVCGPIISEEFNKGTIKQLLIKPYKRSTILTAKLITALLFIPFVILLMVALEVLIGGVILGFNSLKIPILVYNALSGTLTSYSIFKYLFFLILSHLPMYLVLGIICFALSTITCSTSAAITITFLFYLMGNVIANLVLVYKLKFFNYFIALHWDLSYLVTKSINPYNFSYQTSLLVIAFYIVLILCLTYLYFSKKDVKNI